MIAERFILLSCVFSPECKTSHSSLSHDLIILSTDATESTPLLPPYDVRRSQEVRYDSATNILQVSLLSFLKAWMRIKFDSVRMYDSVRYCQVLQQT